MKQVFLKTGVFGFFKFGRKAKGLHLNRFVRDILRECGIPCPKCNEGNCNDPKTALLIGAEVEYVNAVGEKKVASVFSLPEYANNAAAVADNYPLHAWYATSAGDLKRVV